jgi:hypothetical protein
MPAISRTSAVNKGSEALHTRQWGDIAVLTAVLVFSNALFAYARPGWPMAQLAVLWLALNALLGAIVMLFTRWVLLPLRSIAVQLHQLRTTYSEDPLPTIRSPLQISRISIEISRFIGFAREQYRTHAETLKELEQSRRIIAQCVLEQHVLLTSTNREIATQYQSVLAYANYLESQIISNRLDPGLRYDLDDVCESSFNLKLIAGALHMLSSQSPLAHALVPLGALMQQTMITLAPALDRRSMKLTTAEVDLSVAAYADAPMLSHILWMMLLGMVRYAADESTLRIRSFYSHDGSAAMMSIVVSELSPGRMTADERGEHLARQLQHLTPHMFAQTIRIHANVQLADLLLQRLCGTIHVESLTTTSCEICITLPAGCP